MLRKIGFLFALYAFATMCFSDSALALPDKPIRTNSINKSTSQTARRYKRKKRSKKRQKKVKSSPAKAPENISADALPIGPRGRTKVIFEQGSLIKGQTTKAGEVRVLERRESELKSMVKRRVSFHNEIIQTVFPDKMTN
ncbi:MAG: hypothetical protein JRJ87_17230 [Deltaproteobacteria bacterium]|nr:hypothetical protein [Deltaproteobacteria bacterium]